MGLESISPRGERSNSKLQRESFQLCCQKKKKRHLHSLYPAVQKSIQGKGPMTGNVVQLEFGRRNKQGLNSIYVSKLILALILQKLQPLNIINSLQVEVLVQLQENKKSGYRVLDTPTRTPQTLKISHWCNVE